jgi:AmmeMemoRadiSam system protein B/AmmeMemoRadiSam system protein A
MRANALWAIIAAVLLVASSAAQGIRKPVCAGSWYDSRKEALSRQLDLYLEQAKGQSVSHEGIVALISPHAGYVYSGLVAAHAYRLVQGQNYDTVVIVGISHRYAFRGCSIYPSGGYETPLGVAEIDEELASEIAKSTGFKYHARAHSEEHSVEMQVPLIQKTLPHAKIVPIVMGSPSKKTIAALAQAFADSLGKKKVLIVASTDLSHFFPKKKANRVDSETIALIQDLDTDEIIRKMGRNENIMCGGGPVSSVLLFAKKLGNARVELLKYMDSSHAGGPESRVVGYAAAAVYADKPEPPFALDKEEKRELLRIAQSALKMYVLKNQVYNSLTDNPKLISKKGAFVTLKKKGQLRGCIGFIEPVLPLNQTIVQAAIYAASRDVRFKPVHSSELKDIEVEISVLTPLRKIDNPKEVEVGKHGLVIAKGDRKGLLLPQVPVENRWSRQTFLEQTCYKAGLPRDAWRSGASIYVFEAIVFH